MNKVTHTLIAILALAFGLGANASTNTINKLMVDTTRQILLTDVETFGLHLKEGDQSSYKLNIGGFINGSMELTVKSVQADEVVINQNMDLGFLGKQNCDETINPNTGEVKKMVCNGQDQKQDTGDIELIDSKEDTITVPAGTFTCMYIKAKIKKDNSEVEQWVNPKQVPVFGMVKMIAPSQIGKLTVELSSFKKN